jgi:uncharacterized protein YdeI (YjbR/CyaY-like superfamily)
MGTLRFTTTLQSRGPAAAVVLDDEPVAKAAFDALAFTHRKEYVRWITEARREETRQRRVQETLERLRG